METAWNLSWDYSAWKENPKSAPYMQKDWNQTLVTRINQVSAQIFKASYRGGADTIHIHSDLLPIIQTLEFFNEQEMKLSGRYDVVIDDSLNKTRLYVSAQKIINADPFIIWTAFERVEFNEHDEMQPILKDPSEYTHDEIESYKRRLKGCINITNLGNVQDVAWDLEWNFLGRQSPYTQSDWNQTLITKINQVSAQIHNACYRGGADTIYIHSYLEQLFKSYKEYWPNHRILWDRYKVVIDDTLETNVLLIKNEKTLAEPVFIPKVTTGVVNEGTNEKGEFVVETEIIDLSFIPESEFTKEEVDSYISKLKGRITIKNFNPIFL